MSSPRTLQSARRFQSKRAIALLGLSDGKEEGCTEDCEENRNSAAHEQSVGCCASDQARKERHSSQNESGKTLAVRQELARRRTTAGPTTAARFRYSMRRAALCFSVFPLADMSAPNFADGWPLVARCECRVHVTDRE
jgi:hypothetical protein